MNLEKKLTNNIQLECLEPMGNSLLICYISNKNVSKDCCAKVNKVIPLRGNLTKDEITVWSNLEIHSYNFPENMIVNLGQFFTSIEYFSIHNSKLKYIYRSCFSSIASRLIYLDLNYNEIETIPIDAFDDLSKLVYLQLSGNKITHLTSSSFIRNLHKLHTFSANNNNIVEVDGNFFSNSNYLSIKWIYLARNKIHSFAVDLLKFRNLKAIDLRKNFKNCSFLYNAHENNNDIFPIVKFQEKIINYCNIS